MNRILQDLVNLLDLETLEANLFRGQSRDLGGKSVFGGQVIGQALVAAARTVQEAVPHSLHAYFLRPGDMALPIVYEVDRVRDGRSFATRRIQAVQSGRPILTMMVSFQRPEHGLEHQVQMPAVPPPEKLVSSRDLNDHWLQTTPNVSDRIFHSLTRELAIEFKPVDPWNLLAPEVRPAQQHIWFRAGGKLPDKPMLHRSVLAYASDFNLLSTALRPHGRSLFADNMFVASVDHALWFHRDVRADDWLLYSMDAPTTQGARGMSRGLIFDRSGRLVASVVQESLMREIAAGNSGNSHS